MARICTPCVVLIGTPHTCQTQSCAAMVSSRDPLLQHFASGRLLWRVSGLSCCCKQRSSCWVVRCNGESRHLLHVINGTYREGGRRGFWLAGHCYAVRLTSTTKPHSPDQHSIDVYVCWVSASNSIS